MACIYLSGNECRGYTAARRYGLPVKRNTNQSTGFLDGSLACGHRGAFRRPSAVTVKNAPLRPRFRTGTEPRASASGRAELCGQGPSWREFKSEVT